MFKNLLGNMISPQLGLNMVRNNIESELGISIDTFELQYNGVENTVKFKIPVNGQDRIYPFDDNKGLVPAIKQYLEKELKEGDTIDFVIIAYTRKGSEVKIYYRDQKNEKQFSTQKLS